ncbi:hypothetical protein BJP39_18585 [Streptomyces sp. CC77]|uniref:hypothetical protein n=1 Tax=Streptomyces sp. C8S0 TaxID=2585716 RepID=UPI0008DD7299|nr:hypothetical protein BJP39_18585 [Streptomyces sp. CC77]
MKRWWALIVLGTAQFLMVLDTSVEAVTDAYAAAQLDGLKAAILATGGVSLAGLLVTSALPATGRRSPARPDADTPDGAA